MPQECVTLGHYSYDIFVEAGLLTRAGQLIQAAGLRGRAALISDTNVAPHYAGPVEASLREAGYEVSLHEVPAGEGSKAIRMVEEVCRGMIQAGHDRSSFVIALGGGVVGDLAGFVAAIYYRGIPFVQIPTTIVAQVDSSVGGKTGVNTPEGKNLLGSFHQPALVIVDPEVLKTLPQREYLEGFAEAIKHAAIRDASMLAELEGFDPRQDIPSADLLARNLAIKARIVEEDELETSGTRALLNFGHTIGHAIEASAPYGQILHGEAVALGMRAELALSERITGLAPADRQRVNEVIRQYGLPQVLPVAMEDGLLMEKMKRDKKFQGSQYRFALLSALGEAVVTAAVTPEDVIDSLGELRPTGKSNGEHG